MAAKKKPMTQRQKKEKAALKKELQAKGIIPPDKPRLNRRKFVSEAIEEFEAMDVYTADFYLRKAIWCMIAPDMREVTPEAVGVAKLLKIATASARFMEKLKEEGRQQYAIGEYIEEVVLPIKKL